MLLLSTKDLKGIHHENMDIIIQKCVHQSSMPRKNVRSNKFNNKSPQILKNSVICLDGRKIQEDKSEEKGKNYLLTPLSLRKKPQKTDMHRRPCISTVVYVLYHLTKLKLSQSFCKCSFLLGRFCKFVSLRNILIKSQCYS